MYKEAECHEKDVADEISFHGLGVIIQGTVEAQAQTLSSGGFWGTQSFLQQQKTHHQGVVKHPVSCLTWSDAALREWLSRNPDRNNLLLRALSKDLLYKMKA